MRRYPSLGFSLIELMVVVVIIGIFSALAVPGIIEIRFRNVLTDSTDRLRAAGGATRDLAMQSRQAAVLEVRANDAWINLLNGPSCASTQIQTRCTTNLGDHTGLINYTVDSSSFVDDEAGVAMCGGAALATNCTTATTLPRSGFALCYSGMGELYYRSSVDDETTCTATGDPDATATWVQVCSVGTPVSSTVAGQPIGLDDGAAIMFNRYADGSACSTSDANILDIPRIVVFPNNGAPYSDIVPVGGSNNATDTN